MILLCKEKEKEFDNIKRQSVASKKALAEQTRAFMKLQPEEALEAMTSLLHGYQSEVESLSRRCKTSELAFSSLSSSLGLLDVTTRQGSPDQLNAIESLKSEIADLERELTGMKNQDITLRKMETRLKEVEAQRKTDKHSADIESARRVEEAKAQSELVIQRHVTEIESARAKLMSLEEEMAESNQRHLLDKNRLEQTLQIKQDEVNNLALEVESLKVALSSTSGSAIALVAYKDLVEKSEQRVASITRELEQQRTQMIQDRAELTRESDIHRQQAAQYEHERQEQCLKYEALRDALEKALGMTGPVESDRLFEDAIVRISSETNSLRAQVDDLRKRNQELEGKTRVGENLTECHVSGHKEAYEQVFRVESSDSNDVFAIIQSQRDRFRSRVLELEAERDQLKLSQFDLNNRIASLVTDARKIENEKDFWKSQSVESKSRSPNGDIELGTLSRGGPPSLTSVRKRISSTNSMEQTLVSLITWALGNYVTRRVALVYILTLHVLVFFVLYRLSSILSGPK